MGEYNKLYFETGGCIYKTAGCFFARIYEIWLYENLFLKRLEKCIIMWYNLYHIKALKRHKAVG